MRSTMRSNRSTRLSGHMFLIGIAFFWLAPNIVSGQVIVRCGDTVQNEKIVDLKKKADLPKCYGKEMISSPGSVVNLHEWSEDEVKNLLKTKKTIMGLELHSEGSDFKELHLDSLETFGGSELIIKKNLQLKEIVIPDTPGFCSQCSKKIVVAGNPLLSEASLARLRNIKGAAIPTQIQSYGECITEGEAINSTKSMTNCKDYADDFKINSGKFGSESLGKDPIIFRGCIQIKNSKIPHLRALSKIDQSPKPSATCKDGSKSEISGNSDTLIPLAVKKLNGSELIVNGNGPVECDISNFNDGEGCEAYFGDLKVTNMGRSTGEMNLAKFNYYKNLRVVTGSINVKDNSILEFLYFEKLEKIDATGTQKPALVMKMEKDTKTLSLDALKDVKCDVATCIEIDFCGATDDFKKKMESASGKNAKITCSNPSSSYSSQQEAASSKLWMYIAIGVGVFVAIAVVVIIIICCVRRKRPETIEVNEDDTNQFYMPRAFLKLFEHKLIVNPTHISNVYHKEVECMTDDTLKKPPKYVSIVSDNTKDAPGPPPDGSKAMLMPEGYYWVINQEADLGEEPPETIGEIIRDALIEENDGTTEMKEEIEAGVQYTHQYVQKTTAETKPDAKEEHFDFKIYGADFEPAEQEGLDHDCVLNEPRPKLSMDYSGRDHFLFKSDSGNNGPTGILRTIRTKTAPVEIEDDKVLNHDKLGRYPEKVWGRLDGIIELEEPANQNKDGARQGAGREKSISTRRPKRTKLFDTGGGSAADVINRAEFPISRKTLSILLDEAAVALSKDPILLNVDAPIIVVGDTHGRYSALYQLFATHGHPEHGQRYLFLGDYVDKGVQQLENITYLLALKVKYPDRVYLLRGNHEMAEQNIKSFFKEIFARMGGMKEKKEREDKPKDVEKGQPKTKYEDRYVQKLYEHFNHVFTYMPLCAVIGGQIYCSHGGFPRSMDLDDVRNMKRPAFVGKKGKEYYSQTVLDVTWSDPLDKQTNAYIYNKLIEDKQSIYSFNFARGGGLFYTDKAVDRFLKKNNFSMILRGHQIVNAGHRIWFNNKVITIFAAVYTGQFNCGSVAVVSRDLKVHISTLIPKNMPQIDNQRPTEEKPKEESASPAFTFDVKAPVESDPFRTDLSTSVSTGVSTGAPPPKSGFSKPNSTQNSPKSGSKDSAAAPKPPSKQGGSKPSSTQNSPKSVGGSKDSAAAPKSAQKK